MIPRTFGSRKRKSNHITLSNKPPKNTRKGSAGADVDYFDGKKHRPSPRSHRHTRHSVSRKEQKVVRIYRAQNACVHVLVQAKPSQTTHRVKLFVTKTWVNLKPPLPRATTPPRSLGHGRNTGGKIRKEVVATSGCPEKYGCMPRLRRQKQNCVCTLRFRPKKE